MYTVGCAGWMLHWAGAGSTGGTAEREGGMLSFQKMGVYRCAIEFMAVACNSAPDLVAVAVKDQVNVNAHVKVDA